MHAISRAKQAPDYVALRSCGNHRHIVGYSQNGPLVYMSGVYERQEPSGQFAHEVLLGSGFEWRNVLPGSDIPVGAVAVTRGSGRGDAALAATRSEADSRHDPLYIGRVGGRFVGVIDWYRRVCRRAPPQEQCTADGGADEEMRRTKFQSHVFQVLVGRSAVKRE